MSRLLEGKCGFVTGAARGIGAAIALELGAEGAHVVLSDLPKFEAQANAIVGQITVAGGQADFYPGDVTEPGFGESIVDGVQKLGGRIDFAVNNAGIAIHKALADFTDDDFDRIMNVNLKAVFTTMRATLKAMVAQGGGGSIVNTSSIAGVMGVQSIGLYAASKHGVMALTKNAAREYGKYGIRENAILPNAVVTNLGAATRAVSPWVKLLYVCFPEQFHHTDRHQPIPVSVILL